MTKAESLKVGGEEDERRKSLHISVAKYLDQNGFSKTLRKFIKEAKVQKDSLNDASSNLEEMYAKYMEACNAVKSFGNQKLQAVDGQIGTLTKCEGGGKETVGKKNKKGSGESENHDAVKHSEASSELTFSKKSKVVTDDTVPSSDVKSKEKKKSKKNLDSAENVEDSVKASADDVVNEENLDSAGKKSAHKSGNKSASESVEGTKNKEKKKSKKRKGSDLEENDSKSRKTVDTKQKMTDEVEKSERGGKQLNEEGEQANPDACVKTPCKDLTSLENGNSGQEEQKSASQKSSKKQCGSSSEPKTVNAFSRVKIEDVTFADERLQDNSYWAKHGADSGYGAKAQEVLGQVRGRDFRHEKTKKKRGSYRGGQIDLQSHSIKFNYSDEDE